MSSAVSFTAPRVEQREIIAERAALTNKERLSACQDVHGTKRSIVESHVVVRRALANLKQELSLISENRECFDMAEKKCPEYSNSTAFRLMFLRADHFDAKAAAERLMRYWTEKVDLFGNEKAFHPICVQDFDEEDQAALTGGGFKLLPDTDNTGRGIIVSCRPKWDNRHSHRKSMLRVVWYIIHCALEEESVQKRGLIIFSTAQGSSISNFDLKLDRVYVRHLQQVLPIKWKALHQFTKKNSMVEFFLPHFLYLLGPYMRCRYRLHYIAEDKEHLPELARYGMPREILPTEVSGDLDFDYRVWLTGRKFLEAVRSKMAGRNESMVDQELRQNVDAKRILLGLKPSKVSDASLRQRKFMSVDALSEKARVRSMSGLYLTNKNMSVPKKMKLSGSNSAERIAECFRSTIVRTNWKPDEESQNAPFVLPPSFQQPPGEHSSSSSSPTTKIVSASIRQKKKDTSEH